MVEETTAAVVVALGGGDILPTIGTLVHKIHLVFFEEVFLSFIFVV